MSATRLAFKRTLIAGDWHLGSFSVPAAAEAALAFLERTRAAGDDLILNGDVFEGLFEPATRAEAVQRTVREAMDDLASVAQLRRIEGNHDPASGPASLTIEHPVIGRVLVAHGHRADPMQETLGMRVGDAISRRLGWLAPVRAAARLAEMVASAAAARVDVVFRDRCLALARESGCSAGIFGHNHRAHCSPGDPYMNAGCLHGGRLEYLVLDGDGAHLERLDLGPSRGGATVRRTAQAPCSPG